MLVLDQSVEFFDASSQPGNDGDGLKLGLTDGDTEGDMDGLTLGLIDGDAEGDIDTDGLGDTLGEMLTLGLGDMLGEMEGLGLDIGSLYTVKIPSTAALYFHAPSL